GERELQARDRGRDGHRLAAQPVDQRGADPEEVGVVGRRLDYRRARVAVKQLAEVVGRPVPAHAVRGAALDHGQVPVGAHDDLRPRQQAPAAGAGAGDSLQSEADDADQPGALPSRRPSKSKSSTRTSGSPPTSPVQERTTSAQSRSKKPGRPARSTSSWAWRAVLAPRTTPTSSGLPPARRTRSDR